MEQQHLWETDLILIQSHAILKSAWAASLEQKAPGVAILIWYTYLMKILTIQHHIQVLLI